MSRARKQKPTGEKAVDTSHDAYWRLIWRTRDCTVRVEKRAVADAKVKEVRE